MARPEDDVPVEVDPAGANGLVVRADNLQKRFRRADGSHVDALADVKLEVAAGEFVVLLGPSGCGKTTLLRAIAGLERPDSGRIQIRDRTVFDSAQGIDVPPERRRLAMIFQSYALWPHMTAFKNVAYPLRSQRMARAEIQTRVSSAFELVGIPELQRQYPGQMSGGQQQRVALARALVGGGDLILFDEPLSNVDAKVREQLRFELLSMQRELGFAAVYVTHDQAEAMELAHRIAVMRSGEIVQLGRPRDVYTQPASRYVANFVGTSNEIEGVIDTIDGDGAVAQTPLGLIAGLVPSGAGVTVGTEVVASFRPERARLGRDAQSANSWRGTVLAGAFLGPTLEHVVSVGEHRLRVWGGETLLDEGGETSISVDSADVRLLPR